MVKPKILACAKCGYLIEHCRCRNPKTNADRIRAMSDEELAEFLLNGTDNPMYEKNEDVCDYCEKCDDENALCSEDGCKNAIVKWLQSEVEG